MAEREVRDYELSLWTLQDSFITVLKPFGQEIKGQVQEGKLHISDDGTESLSFSIPMYLYQRDGNNGAVKVENPLWHNVINGILIANMRKIKLIFDKHGTREKVFEFIILKTTERHESDQLFCDVECEGLAFHELGKIGYKLELSADEFELDHKNWEESDKTEDEPVATLQYWNNKIFSNRRDWSYEVRMDYREEIGREGLSSEKVYEDRYVASWTVVDDQIQPTRWELGKEKARTTFDIKESNIYNITQEIAEAFGVFCKYEYEHDYNYHITKRIVVYYNNFLNEEAGVIDLTYPYNTNNITREMDSTDLITKMYVQSVDDELTDEGTVSITSVEANKMKEDYLLNFDYLYNIGTISQEQYDGIKEFEVEIRKLNEKFEKYSEIYSHRANQINNLEADIQSLKDAIVADNEELNTVNEQIRALGLSDGDGKASSVKIAPPNPNSQRTPFLSTKKNGRMAISLIAEHSRGINDPKSNIHVYAHYDSKTGELLEEKSWKLYSNNKTNEIYELYNLPSKDKSGEIISTYFVTYTCTPSLQYKEIKDNFTKKLSQDTRRLNKLTKRYENIKKIYENAEKQIESLRTKKAKLILEFEHLMGSALREGYWNPENYNDYGNKYTGNIRLNRTTSSKHTTLDLGIRAQNIPVSDTSDRYLEFMWGNGKDSTGDELDIWADEQKSYYEEGVNLDKIYYPCIRISGPVLKKMIQNKENINLFSLLFYIGDETDNQRVLEDIDGWIGFNIGSQCQIGFRKGYLKGDKTKPYIFPVFVMTGLDDYTEDTAMAVMSTVAYFAQTQELIDGEIQMEDIEAAAKKTTADDELLWWYDNDNVNGANRLTKKVQTSEGIVYVSLGEDYYPVPAYDLYYPRIIIKSQKLKKSSDGTEPDLTIKCGNSISGASSLQKLTDYEDYSIINSISEVEDTDEDALPYMYEAITIKPFSLLCYGSTTRNQNGTDIYCPMPILQIDYTISNADTAIYLDAIQVLKENSQPKVSYTIDLNNLGRELINTAYNLLGIVAHINDTDLKFNNIQGYVSEVEMDLDKPWEDSITIQNYKNKFEDLFSKIVAETVQMQKNSYTVGFAAQALTAGGGITGDVMQYTLANTNLTYAFNNGRLTIDEVNGIIGESRDGIVAYRGGGIFTASEKDDEGNWIWNTGILPTGINASLITTGRLDTNQVNVYAGNDLRFVWNGQGLTAYKWNTVDGMNIAAANGDEHPELYAPGLDTKQYVRYNGEGLYLIAEPGSWHIKKNNNTAQVATYDKDEAVKRVEVSWDGFILRNWENEKVFWADPDTGNLTLNGTLSTSIKTQLQNEMHDGSGKTTYQDTSYSNLVQLIINEDGFILNTQIYEQQIESAPPTTDHPEGYISRITYDEGHVNRCHLKLDKDGFFLEAPASVSNKDNKGSSYIHFEPLSTKHDGHIGLSEWLNETDQSDPTIAFSEGSATTLTKDISVMPNLYSNNLWGNEVHILDFEVGKYVSDSSEWQIGTSITYSGIKTNNLEVDKITAKNLTITSGKIGGFTVPDKLWINKYSPSNKTYQNTALSKHRGQLWCYYHGTPVDNVPSTTTTVTTSDPRTISSEIITNTYKGDSSYNAKNWIYHGAGSSKPILSVTATTKNSCDYYKDNTSTTTSTITGGSVKKTILKEYSNKSYSGNFKFRLKSQASSVITNIKVTVTVTGDSSTKSVTVSISRIAAWSYTNELTATFSSLPAPNSSNGIYTITLKDASTNPSGPGSLYIVPSSDKDYGSFTLAVTQKATEKTTTTTVTTQEGQQGNIYPVDVYYITP